MMLSEVGYKRFYSKTTRLYTWSISSGDIARSLS